MALFELLYGALVDSPQLLAISGDLIHNSLLLASQCLLQCPTLDGRALSAFVSGSLLSLPTPLTRVLLFFCFLVFSRTSLS